MTSTIPSAETSSNRDKIVGRREMLDQGMISLSGHLLAAAIVPVNPLPGSVEKAKVKILGLFAFDFCTLFKNNSKNRFLMFILDACGHPQP